jgi:hypothetical protein
LPLENRAAKAKNFPIERKNATQAHPWAARAASVIAFIDRVSFRRNSETEKLYQPGHEAPFRGQHSRCELLSISARVAAFRRAGAADSCCVPVHTHCAPCAGSGQAFRTFRFGGRNQPTKAFPGTSTERPKSRRHEPQAPSGWEPACPSPVPNCLATNRGGLQFKYIPNG